MQVPRVSSHQPAPFWTASASLAQLQVTTHDPLPVSHTDPAAHCVSIVQVGAGFGLHEPRATSHTKPVPHCLSVVQNPPSAQTPSAEQKHPAAHWASPLHSNPGG